MAKTNSKKKPRFKLRISLRMLSFVITTTCVTVAWYLNRVITQRRVVAQLVTAGSSVLPEDQVTPLGDEMLYP